MSSLPSYPFEYMEKFVWISGRRVDFNALNAQGCWLRIEIPMIHKNYYIQQNLEMIEKLNKEGVKIKPIPTVNPERNFL